MVKRFLIFLIKGYQKFISPLLGDNCRFYPTCSAYAIEALRVHGALKGSQAVFRHGTVAVMQAAVSVQPARKNGGVRPVMAGRD